MSGIYLVGYHQSKFGWCSWQLTNQVPDALQVKDIDHAANFNIGGPICASVVFALRRNQ